MPIIYFDESGNTGSNYLDPDQPAYALASIIIDPQVGQDLLTRHFGRFDSTDIKHSKLSGHHRGQEAIKACLRELEEVAPSYKIYLVLKRFGLICKYVELVIHPSAEQCGFDLHEGGETKRFADLLWFCGPHMYRREDCDQTLLTFQRWATGKGVSLEALTETVLKLKCAGSSNEADEIVKLPFNGMHKIECPAGPGYSMDVSFTSAYASLRSWMEEGLDEIDIVHDRSKVMQEQVGLWPMLADAETTARLFAGLPGEWPPLPVNSVNLADKDDQPLLQLADIIAGAGTTLASLKLGARNDQYAVYLRDELGLQRHVCGGVWPEKPEGSA